MYRERILKTIKQRNMNLIKNITYYCSLLNNYIWTNRKQVKYLPIGPNKIVQQENNINDEILVSLFEMVFQRFSPNKHYKTNRDPFINIFCYIFSGKTPIKNTYYLRTCPQTWWGGGVPPDQNKRFLISYYYLYRKTQIET